MTPDGGAPPRKGFWGRNWKWLVPVGCLSMLGCCGCGVGAIVVGVFGVIKETDVYKEALSETRRDPEVGAALGQPIKEGWWLSGNVSTSGGSGNADLAIPVSGPKASGTLYVRAAKRGQDWRFTRLVVEVEGRREQIDVLHGQGAPEPNDDVEPEDDGDDEADGGEW